MRSFEKKEMVFYRSSFRLAIHGTRIAYSHGRSVRVCSVRRLQVAMSSQCVERVNLRAITLTDEHCFSGRQQSSIPFVGGDIFGYESSCAVLQITGPA